MVEVRVNQDVTVRITPKIETLLGEICTAIKNLEEGLDSINFFVPYRFGENANFHSHDAALPDMTLGELIKWVDSFACIEGPELAKQEPAGATLVKSRARQLDAMLKPLAARVSQIADDPSYRGHQPFLFMALAHPKVCWAFDDVCSKIGTLAR